MLNVAGKWRMMNSHDQCKVRVGSLQFATEPVDLVLMKLAFGFTHIGA